MIDPSAYLSKATPIDGGELARLYWQTATSLDEIIARFDPGAAKAHFYKKVGGAWLDLRCVDCGEQYAATSRQDAATALSEREHRCAECDSKKRQRDMEARHRKWAENAKRAEELRWMPYPEFLGTDEWAANRRKALIRAEFKCQVCACSGKLHVHHRTYARRGSERPADLTALCAECHQLFHDHGRLAASGRAS